MKRLTVLVGFPGSVPAPAGKLAIVYNPATGDLVPSLASGGTTHASMYRCADKTFTHKINVFLKNLKRK